MKIGDYVLVDDDRYHDRRIESIIDGQAYFVGLKKPMSLDRLTKIPKFRPNDIVRFGLDHFLVIGGTSIVSKVINLVTYKTHTYRNIDLVWVEHLNY
ncbi:hypothetical protein MM5_197 [Morganella phage vB_Mm5]